MTSTDTREVRIFPPAPKEFDALTASKTDLARHGLPQRPDPRTRSGPAALWEQRAVALPVRPGDTLSATLCLQTDSAGTAAYFLANETTSQTVNFTIETGFPPAHAINAGVSRGSQSNGLPDPLAGFGSVYFDELTAFATSGSPRLTDGVPTTMVDRNGATLARPERLTDFTFKVIPA